MRRRGDRGGFVADRGRRAGGPRACGAAAWSVSAAELGGWRSRRRAAASSDAGCAARAVCASPATVAVAPARVEARAEARQALAIAAAAAGRPSGVNAIRQAAPPNGQKRTGAKNDHGSSPLSRGWTDIADQDLNAGLPRRCPFRARAPGLCVRERARDMDRPGARRAGARSDGKAGEVSRIDAGAGHAVQGRQDRRAGLPRADRLADHLRLARAGAGRHDRREPDADATRSTAAPSTSASTRRAAACR